MNKPVTWPWFIGILALVGFLIWYFANQILTALLKRVDVKALIQTNSAAITQGAVGGFLDSIMNLGGG